MDETLEKLFQLQISFQKRLGIFIPEINKKKEFIVISKKDSDIIKNQILSIIDESMEALREIPWKPWKHGYEYKRINLQAYRMELIDIFHFLINLFIFAGMDSKKVFEMFFEKNKINNQRQDNGY